MKKTTFSQFAVVLALIVFSLLTSCVSSKRLAYFTNIARDSTSRIEPNKIENHIAMNDVLHINISTPDVATTTILNSPIATSSAATPGAVNGYLVDEKGEIKLPLLGVIKVEGLTKSQLADKIAKDLVTKKIALDPIVNIRIISYKITVLGEVGRPGVIAVPNERMTLPEALGAAGDLTPYGKRDNVLLIRESPNGERIYKRFSLNASQMFDKDIYNLQNQDIIYVEPNRARAQSSDGNQQYIPYIFSTISILLVLYVQFFK